MIISTIAVSCIALANISLQQPITATDWAKTAYGPSMEFLIRRNGKEVGSHTVSFDSSENQTVVQSSTSIKVKFFFITAYSFKYDAKETWVAEKLVSVDSKTKDGSDEFEFNKTFEGEEFLFPTNHWNPNVLMESAVYNTITGKTNSISIQSDEWELLPTGTGTRNAQRYDYSGDLKDVSAWYDEQGRWVALRFKAKDGSTITYECKRCGV